MPKIKSVGQGVQKLEPEQPDTHTHTQTDRQTDRHTVLYKKLTLKVIGILLVPNCLKMGFCSSTYGVWFQEVERWERVAILDKYFRLI